MNASNTLRFIAAIAAVGITAAIFSSVVTLAEQTQEDGSVKLAHTVVGSQPSIKQILIAQADTAQE
jgi:hypothetical protein